MRHIWQTLFFGLALAVIGSAVPALAASSAGLSAATKELARQHYENGQKAEHAGDLQEAARLYQAAISADKKFAEAYNQLGYVQRRLGLYDQSIANYKQALKLKPKMAAAHEYIARAYMAQGNFAMAHEHLRTLESLEGERAQRLAKDLATDLTAAEAKAKAAEAEPAPTS